MPSEWRIWDWLSLMESVSMVVIAGAALVVAWAIWASR